MSMQAVAPFLSGQGGPRTKVEKSASSRRRTTGGKASRKAANEAPGPGSGPGPSFLFVVNEFVLENPTGAGLESDSWMNKLPPMQADDFKGEVVGTVFRWHSGVVSRAEGYAFSREDVGEPGLIAHDDWYSQNVDDGPDDEDVPMATNLGRPTVYSEASVFFCGTFLPCAVANCDASQGLAFTPNRQVAGWDERMRDTGFVEWRLLNFAGDGTGVSFANSRYVGGPYVRGRNAAWMPALVPTTFANHAKPSLEIPESRGLGGELAIVLALMALHGRPGQPTSVFERNYWTNNRWDGPRHSPGADRSPLTNSDMPPRGFFVQICLDDWPDGGENRVSSWDIMKELERNQIWVKG